MKPILTDELLRLLQKVSEHYQPPPLQCKRGRRQEFSEQSFLLLAVAAVVTRTFADSELFRLLQADAGLLSICGFSRTPHRTTILRRLKSLTTAAERQISLSGAKILQTFAAPEEAQTVSAIDGRMYQAMGPRSPQKASPREFDSCGAQKCRSRKRMVQKRLSRMGARLSLGFAVFGLSLSRAACGELESQ